jgi:hypothetical protein
MKTFLLGLLMASVVAAVVGFGLQRLELSAASTYSTDNVRLSANS